MNPESSDTGNFPIPYYVYQFASRKDGTLYLGVTRDLVRRTYEHKIKATPSFASRYDVRRLVWFEIYDDPTSAITREKEIKKWRRSWKVELIERKILTGRICMKTSHADLCA